MKRRILTLTIFVLSLGLMFSSAAFAQDQKGAKPEGDDTIAVVEQDDDYNDVVNQIALPEVAAQQGKDNSHDGLETARQAREHKREFGMERAQEARQNEMREQVREQNRENIQDRMPERDAIRDRAREHMPPAE